VVFDELFLNVMISSLQSECSSVVSLRPSQLLRIRDFLFIMVCIVVIIAQFTFSARESLKKIIAHCLWHECDLAIPYDGCQSSQ
jgi:hypothetical protein